MFLITERNLKILIGLLVLCFLSIGIQIYQSINLNGGYNQIIIFISLFQCIIYFYNLLWFRKILKIEHEELNLNFISVVLTIYFLINSISLIIHLLHFDNTILTYSSIIGLLSTFINILFSVFLFRINSAKYKRSYSLIGISLLLSLLASFVAPYLIFLHPTYSTISSSIYIFSLLPELAFAYFYYLVIKNIQSGKFGEEEDRFTIGENKEDNF